MQSRVRFVVRPYGMADAKIRIASIIGIQRRTTMIKTIEFDVYVHIHGIVEAKSDEDADLLDAIFPDGCEGEVDSIFTDPSFMPKGYIRCTDEEE